MGSYKAPTTKSSATVLVSPKFATEPDKRHLALSIVDGEVARIYTPVLLLYAAPANVEFQEVVATLKDSLQKALVEYYPFAGRFVKGENGLPEIRCDDSGAYFTEVVVEEELDDLGGSEACVALSGMEAVGLSCRGFHSLDEHEELPPLVIQVTSFKCQSIALTVNWHHQVADGCSGMSFLKAWSELARGLSITCPPDHRCILIILKLQTPFAVTSSATRASRGLPPGYKVLSAQPQERESTQSSDVTEVKKLLPKKVEFTISEDEIQQLKKEAAEGSTCGAFTSGECISAHLWRLATKARGLNREAMTSLYSVIDARKRIKDFPRNYFGNCVFVAKSVCQVADVLDMPLGHMAKLIHDSISGVTDDYIRSFLDYVHVAVPSRIAGDRATFTTHDLQPTFWRYFPIYELDFGFGIPRYGGRNSHLTGSTGFAAVCPTLVRDGSVLILLYLHADAADNLAASLRL